MKLLPLILLFPFVLAAQPKVEMSETISGSGDVIVNGIARHPGSDNIILVYESTFGAWSPRAFSNSKKWGIEVYNADLKQIKAGEAEKIKLPNGDFAQTGKLVCFGGVVRILFDDYDKSSKSTTLYSAPIQPDGAMGGLTKLAKVDGKLAEGNPKYTISSDSSFMLISKAFYAEKSLETLPILLINKNWEVVYKGDLNFPHSKDGYLINYPIVCSDGSIWMNAWTLGLGDDIAQEIWVWRDPKNKPVQKSIALSPEYLVTSVQLQSDGETVLVGGLYSDMSKMARKALSNPGIGYGLDKSLEKGSFFIQFDLFTESMKLKKSNPFGAETTKYWKPYASEAERKSGISWLTATGVYPLKNGNTWLTFEEFVVPPTSERGTTGALDTGGTPKFGPGVAILYNSSGEVIQEHQIDKRAWPGRNRGGSQYFAADVDKIVCLHNGIDKNLTIKERKASSVKPVGIPNGSGGIKYFSKSSCAIMQTIDAKGQSIAKKMFALKDTQYWIEPTVYIVVAPRVVVLACEGLNGNHGLIKVRY